MLIESSPTLRTWAVTLLRVVVGIVFLAHGWQKLFTLGIGGVEGFFGSLGIPAAGAAATLVTVVELVGGLALILGLGTRIAAALLAIDMLVALLVVHLPNGIFAQANGYELVLVLMTANLFFLLAGPGLYSLDAMLTGRQRQPATRPAT